MRHVGLFLLDRTSASIYADVRSILTLLCAFGRSGNAVKLVAAQLFGRRFDRPSTKAHLQNSLPRVLAQQRICTTPLLHCPDPSSAARLFGGAPACRARYAKVAKDSRRLSASGKQARDNRADVAWRDSRPGLIQAARVEAIAGAVLSAHAGGGFGIRGRLLRASEAWDFTNCSQQLRFDWAWPTF